MASVKISDDSFEKDVLKSDNAVVVDFWAEWCGPCRALSPVLDEVANEIKDSGIKIAKMNVDENPTIPSKYGVRGIPTLMIFKGGELKETRVGALPKADLKKWIEDNS